MSKVHWFAAAVAGGMNTAEDNEEPLRCGRCRRSYEAWRGECPHCREVERVCVSCQTHAADIGSNMCRFCD